MSIHPIRRLVNKFGIDILRYRGNVDRLAWLGEHNIRTVFDIGANIGQFAREIRERQPDVEIYSFEPIKECYDRLISNFQNDTRFHAFNYALGENDSRSAMNKSSYSLSSSLLTMGESHKTLFPHTRESTIEEVQVRRLDEIFDELKADKNIMIKVDTQGYENKVIAGGIETFKMAKVSILETSYVELYRGQALFDEIYEKMKSLGFSYYGALHQKINPRNGEVIFEDSIFIQSKN